MATQPIEAGVGEYSLEILRGVTTARDLLSCQPGGKVDLWTVVDSSGRQIWKFEPGRYGFRIRVTGGTNDPNSIYLTGRGRNAVILAPWSEAIHQFWELVALKDSKPNLYNLKNVICEEGDYRFLSTSADGSVVDRWIEDDESGRQKWQLQGQPIPPV